MICLVSGGLRSIAPSQKPARFVRIQHLPKSKNPLLLRDSGSGETVWPAFDGTMSDTFAPAQVGGEMDRVPQRLHIDGLCC